MALLSHRIMETCDQNPVIASELTERSISRCTEVLPLYSLPTRLVKAVAQEKQNNFRKEKRSLLFLPHCLDFHSSDIFTPKEIWLWKSI